MKRKLMLIGGGVLFASSLPLIAASCENKNPTDESIINNTTPQTQGNQNQENPNGTGNSSTDTTPQTKDNQNHQENKNKEEKPNGSGSSSSNTNSQTQDKQKQEDKDKEEKKDNPKDLLKQLEEIKQEYEKAKKDNEKLIEESNYFNDLKQWFEGYIPKINHKWNNYSQFRIEVQKKEITEGWLKLAKEFIEKYKTKIKKDLKERKILIE